MVIRERLTNGQEKSNFDFLTSCRRFLSFRFCLIKDLSRPFACVHHPKNIRKKNPNSSAGKGRKFHVLCRERCVCGCGGEIRHHPLLGRLLLFKTQSIDDRQSIHQATTRRAFLLLLPWKKKVNVTRMCSYHLLFPRMHSFRPESKKDLLIT